MAVLPGHKTKIVATIGPASESREMLERLINAGMNIARLNFSHGDFPAHGKVIRRIREAEKAPEKKSRLWRIFPVPKCGWVP